ncbi:hypothetical protein [Amycolatopsis sp. PS_44_ISF1]|uniref:hypothetical protein n=1 Tax=Amycolatopsis sp. PS_44_ISF1 TaxID=2974917 RepID=UPI0028DF6418|nr:hypothetical protein [Amycolatopsis sp. PS_44_ISF1]MDT8915803.1 hypothetical protein [Amycolatopsis sp. PS_44_ISF1]MDT8916270.1 hypothetical protein [Amycolatopsis sp. PS_44_ISF1]
MTTFRRNDPVIVREVEAIHSHIYVGKKGRFRGTVGSTNDASGKPAYLVEVNAWDGSRTTCTIRATRIERDTLKTGRFQAELPTLTQPGRVSVGDRVRVVEVLPSDSSGSRLKIGQTGTVEEAVPANGIRPGFHRVRVGAALVRATTVERVAGSLPMTHADEPTAESRPKPVDALIDPKRLQAAHAAHALLGEDATLDTLIGLGEFILGEHAKGGRVDLGALAAPSTHRVQTAPDMTLDEARRVTSETLHINSLDVGPDLHPDSDVIMMEVRGSREYLTEEQVDKLIAYLRAAKLVHTAR